ncbi:TPA: hypothetical protein DDZ49_01635 [Candidatus Wolfebacteria bacterium]|nr:MAG: hypothetical protein UX70_C0001G0812 [Candidatus Wolfebacteria bacterium GW2011_GWB1_47_1]KKU53728.1 MAG: hypothetical protein UX76_C0011G0073 [Candidatus Wolfebacteria bacterium GW2011_GWC1_47_103]HAL24902.1 hypothetical protein [Candidatus Wolfebacteria bacterium]HBD18473.1 hypothetical protein [Candidatus Wolfebacteria bacterium]HBN86860.1 hypothetical protein [Candidatus Wolfebacteria bacterium]
MTYLLGPSSWELYSKTDQYEKYVRNPSKTEKETGQYFPRLTGYKRRFAQDANVRIELSVPKLLYRNNLDELEEKDFPRVIEILLRRLETMGVVVDKSVLENASVSSVHFSKNILLQDGYTANHLISEMNKVNLKKNFDFAKTRFMNDGQSLYAHTTSHQLVIYDKIADMGKDAKRAMDKDQTSRQKSLFAELSKASEQLEIIRFEIRLNHKQKMNKLLENLGYEKNPVFRQVFNTKMSKTVVAHYWEKLIKERNLGIFSISLSIKDVLRTLFLADKTLKPKQAIYLLGLFMLAKDEGGLRQLRTIVSKRSRDRTWYRIAQDMQQASKLITKNKLRDWVTQIDKSLDEYVPYKHKKSAIISPLPHYLA